MAAPTPAPDLPVAEYVEGARFTWVERTPWLRRMIRHGAEALAAAGAGDVRVSEPLVLDERSTVIPDIVVEVDRRPCLVVEYRTESTDRYVLGPKRLVYGRAGIPELWFVDPRAGSITTLHLASGARDYAWPGKRHAAGETLDVACAPPLHVRAADLMRDGDAG